MTRGAKVWVIAGFVALCSMAALVQRELEKEQPSVLPSELYEVVHQQLNAFRADDFASAYRQVSSGFQERVNITAFADWVRAEYPGVARAERLEFGAVRFDGRRALVPAYFFLPDGDVIPCVYSLVNEEGGWKIDGARLLRRWPAGRRLSGVRT